MFQSLIDRGFQVEFHAHAAAIIGTDFPEVVAELEPPLLEMSVPIAELIASGGGEAKATQRLRHALKDKGWDKQRFVVEKTINGVRRESTTHEMDHVRHYGHGTIALEIEWNNKDPFFDRDLEKFKRLHADGVISAGIIVTRGRSLHEALRDLVHGFVAWHQLYDIGQLASWRPRASAGKSNAARREPGIFALPSPTCSRRTNSARRRRIGASWKTGSTAGWATRVRSC